ncbi:hypothetical protein PILCRDRAFT_825413 [Piloderma croceum F 1598]|uniref:DUF6593 domain-containing protein n=1 Tax=Piloderma croceum (strain F 1598) TaxID=765440 RepID=A0A0C3AU34_PILCF|nr:hypothetical protein PILCRDRAFT_825413 [Piloderma croceum F 1598]
MFKDSLSFAGPNKKRFSWKKVNDGLNIELYQDGAKNKAPIAKFTKRRRVTHRDTIPPTSEIMPAKLVLDGRGLGMRDLVVITFCLSEKARRSKEDSTFHGVGNMGEGMGMVGLVNLG